MVQYGLWPNCTNKCDFCLLQDRIYKSKKERLRVLAAVKENIKTIDWKGKFSDGISLLGGEIFYTEHEEIKNSFLELIDEIVEVVFGSCESTRLSIVSNGIYDPNVLLIPVIEKLNNKKVLDRFDLNFSYDIKYRFHSEESRIKAIENINLVYDKYKIVPCVQTCLTQYLIDAHLDGSFNIFDFKETNFPHTILTFLYPHKINTGKTLDDFFFKRQSLMKFIMWMRRNGYQKEIENFIQSVINSSQFKYTGLLYRGDVLEDKDDKDEEIKQEPVLGEKQILSSCGHSQLYKCYSDCDKCMLCDLLKVL